MQVLWGEFIDASSSMLLLVLEAFIMFEISKKFIPSSLLLLLFICFLFKTFMIVLSEFASLWQATRPFFVKFTSILFYNLMTTSSRITWRIFSGISAVSKHSLEGYCSSLWTDLHSSVILKLLMIILFCSISLSLASSSNLLWVCVIFSFVFFNFH